jgi:hypothetical protein
MSRPRLSDEEKKEKRLTVRFRLKEMEELSEQAGVCGLSVSEFVRRSALQRRIIPATDLRMISELRRTTGLLKFLHNETGGLYKQKTSVLLNELHAAILRIGRKEGGEL